MKITDVRVVSKGLHSAPAIVQVETDEGVTGIGATAAHIPAIAALIEAGPDSLRSLVIGEDPTETNRLWRKMFTRGDQGRGGEGGLVVNAMAAIDMALWDIAGKALGLPIYRLLGGAVQPQVMAYSSTTAIDVHVMERSGEWVHKSTEDLVLEIRQFVEEGFKAIKFGWGNFFAAEDLEALAAIREAIGPDIHLMLDFGCPAYLKGGWNVKDAIKVSKVLEAYDIFFLEEPLHPFNVKGFATLTRESPIKIATGESLTTVREFQWFLDARAIDIVQPDAQQIGITQYTRVAQRAEEAGVPCIPHGPWTAFTIAAHLNVQATVSNGIMIEYPAFAHIEAGTEKRARLEAMHNKIIETPVTLRDGYLQLPQSPGLGLGELVPEALRELQGQ